MIPSHSTYDIKKYQEENSIIDSESGLEVFQDKEFEIISSYFCEIPSDSPFVDTDLVLFKDHYAGLMPLNGIKETEFKKTEELFKEIIEGKAKLEIDRTHLEFFQELEKDIKKLLTRNLGRKLIIKACQETEKIQIIKNTDKEGSCYAYAERQILLNRKLDARYLAVSIDPSGKRNFFIHPSYILLGHELMHALSPDLVSRAKSPPTLGKKYDDLEEQVTITGLLQHLAFPIRNESQKEDIDSSEAWAPWMVDYQELNERNLTAAFTDRDHCFYPRVGHRGLTIGMIANISLVKEIISDSQNLPVPNDFVENSMLILKNPMQLNARLNFLINILEAAKTSNPKDLNQTLLSFKKLKEFGDWKLEDINQLLEDSLITFKKTFFQRRYENLFQDYSDAVPEKLKPIFETFFQRYRENLSTLDPSKTEKNQLFIHEDLWDYLIEKKLPQSHYKDDGDERTTVYPQELASSDGLLRLYFLPKEKIQETQEFICYLGKNSKHFLEPIQYPIISFLDAKKLFTYFREIGYLENLSSKILKFFEPALVEVMKNFLRQVSGEHEEFLFSFFEELFNYPDVLMQKFQAAYTYAGTLRLYLLSQSENNPAFSPEQQEIISHLEEKLDRLHRIAIDAIVI